MPQTTQPLLPFHCHLQKAGRYWKIVREISNLTILFTIFCYQFDQEIPRPSITRPGYKTIETIKYTHIKSHVNLSLIKCTNDQYLLLRQLMPLPVHSNRIILVDVAVVLGDDHPHHFLRDALLSSIDLLHLALSFLHLLPHCFVLLPNQLVLFL